MGGELPKPLVAVGGVPLLGRTLGALAKAGVSETLVVVGHRALAIARALPALAPAGMTVHVERNPDFHLPNGVSLRTAAGFVTERTLVLMADHVFADAMLEPLVALSAAGAESVVAIDRDLAHVFDLADATKVRTHGASGAVLAIGKRLRRFDAIDTGLFAVAPSLLGALSTLDAPSLSDGVRLVARAGLMHTVEVTGAPWVDVDTPLARLHAERLLAGESDSLQAWLDKLLLADQSFRDG